MDGTFSKEDRLENDPFDDDRKSQIPFIIWLLLNGVTIEYFWRLLITEEVVLYRFSISNLNSFYLFTIFMNSNGSN